VNGSQLFSKGKLSWGLLSPGSFKDSAKERGRLILFSLMGSGTLRVAVLALVSQDQELDLRIPARSLETLRISRSWEFLRTKGVRGSFIFLHAEQLL